MESGPFDEKRFAELTDNRWSLLVTDVEKQVPELRHWLEPFSFLPQWRIDDLMVSYAPDGASVGAHVDEYDVFLLQASGCRTWKIDSSANQAMAPTQAGQLKILDQFSATDTWDLVPGDMLYLPPGFAHHGIAKGDDCTTWSIGFRAPRFADMVTRVAESIAEQQLNTRFTDGKLTVAENGQITQQAIDRFRQAWKNAVELDDKQFARIIGEWLTETDHLSAGHESGQAPDTDANSSLTQSAFSRFSWAEIDQIGSESPQDVCLFVDGATYYCPRQFAVQLCSCNFKPIEYRLLSKSEKALVDLLIASGSIYHSNNQ